MDRDRGRVMGIDLDDPDVFRKFDPQGMLARIAELPMQCREAWRRVQSLELPSDYLQVEGVVILGIGGSAIGGDLLRTLVNRECPVPILVNRDYDVPAFVGPQTLVIASSYSGKTEETLSAFEEAWERGAKLLAVTTDGELARRARALGIPLLLFDYKSQPRAALGHSFILLLGALNRLGLVADKSADLDEAIEVMEALQREINEEVPLTENPAKRLAERLHGRLPVVYGAEHLAEVARRWKTQFNENSKAWSFFEQLPELNHNAVVGYEFPTELADRILVIILSSSLYRPRIRVRFQVTKEILAKRRVDCEEVEALGRSPLAQMLSTIHFGDYVSYYLAMLYQVDPTPVGIIDYLKERLAQL